MTFRDSTDANSSEQHRWLIAAFKDESFARRAARAAETSGTDVRDIRIGNSLDALASVEAEMREELDHTAGVTHRRHRDRGAVRRLLGGMFGPKRPSEPLAASNATMLAVPDSVSARRALLQARPTRIDVFGAGGFLLGTLATDEARPD